MGTVGDFKDENPDFVSYYDDPSEHESNTLTKNVSKLLASVLLIIGGGFFIHSTLSASLNLNNGVSVEFGQGITQTAACSGSRSVVVTPSAAFTNASNSGTHYLGNIKVGNIPSSCSNVYITLSIYPDSDSMPKALFGSVTSLSILDVNNIFYLADQSYSSSVGITSTSASCVGGTAGTCYSFTVTFKSPSLLTSNVAKIVLESGINTFACLRASAFSCTLTDVTLTDVSLRGLAWSSIASSSDGTRLAATVSGGGVYTSSNSGLTWTETSLANVNWLGMASSADGNKLVVTSYAGYVYRSTNAGATWTQASVNDYFTGIASGSDGNYLTMVTNRGCVYISSDSGVSWTRVATTPSKLNTVTLSSSGQYQYITNSGNISGDIYKSSDYGATWTDVTPSGTGNNLFYTAISTSSDGSHIAASSSGPGAGIYTSSDAGATWSKATIPSDPGSWISISSSSDGATIVAASTGHDIYLSNDYGATWQNQTPIGTGHNLNWDSVAIRSDGARFVGIVSLGNIYVSNGA